MEQEIRKNISSKVELQKGNSWVKVFRIIAQNAELGRL